MKARLRTASGLRERVRSGLPYSALEALAGRLDSPVVELGEALRIPARTLARRRHAGRLTVEESDRLVRVGRVAALAEQVLGDRDRALRWLRQPNRALGRSVPLRHVDTDLGAREVETVLLRLEHGVHS
jgi:putative toxin-antitoxin system antitoxin component (TIGR02293 family)